MLEHRRRQIADIDFVKKIVSNVQRHKSQIRASLRGRSPMPLTALAICSVGGHPAGSGGDFKGHRNGQVSDVTVVTRN